MARDTDLEERIAHLQRLVDDLSDVLARQDGDLRRLRAQVDLLVAREADREAAGGVVLGDERPPHW
ncbi:MAG: SlyX family protein [Shimia sp.]